MRKKCMLVQYMYDQMQDAHKFAANLPTLLRMRDTDQLQASRACMVHYLTKCKVLIFADK
jgi:hypothetical protein